MWLLETSIIDPLPTEPFVGVNFWTIIFAWVNLLVLYVLLKKLLFVPIKNMIDSRQKEIDDMYSDAETSRDNAKELQAEYEQKLLLANEESDAILRAAQRRAELGRHRHGAVRKRIFGKCGGRSLPCHMD